MIREKMKETELMKKSVSILFFILIITSFKGYSTRVIADSNLTNSKSVTSYFRLITAVIKVEDINGIPLEGVKVLAFSEDWGIRSPGTLDQKNFWITDPNGSLSITIPIGNWSFFAISGHSYAITNPGHGIFIALINQAINNNISITMKPDSIITLYPLDSNGNRIDVEARIMETNHTPIIPTEVAAISLDGKMQIQVSDEYNYDILIVRRPTLDFEGYYILIEDISPFYNGEITPSELDLSTVVFEALNDENRLTKGNIEVRLPTFDFNNMVIDFNFEGNATVYITPSVVQFNYRFIEAGWYLYLGGNNFFNLTNGEYRKIIFGGPFTKELQVIPWASRGTGGSPKFNPKTQIWLKITDAYNHVLRFMGTPSGKPSFPFSLVRNGTVIFESTIPQGDPFTLSIPNEYEEVSSPQFNVTGDLGPFGTFALSGELISEETMYKVQNITTKHFLAAVPEGFPEMTPRKLDFMDQLYEICIEMTGAPIDGLVQYEVDITGGGFWWEHIPAPAKVLLVTYSSSDPLSPNTLFFTAHEFGHTRTLRDPTIISLDYFGESYPTLIAIEGISRIYGDNMWLWGTGSHDLFFYHLKGVPIKSRSDIIEMSQFVLAFIQKIYGWNVHRDIISGWSGNFSNIIDYLEDRGFKKIENLAVLYSYVIGENIGELFQIAGLEVKEEKVKEGLDLIDQANKPEPERSRGIPSFGLESMIIGLSIGVTMLWLHRRRIIT